MKNDELKYNQQKYTVNTHCLHLRKKRNMVILRLVFEEI